MIVEGSVVRSGDRVRVTAQLIDAKPDHHLWARSYDHTLRDVLALQGRIASEIAKEVRGVLTPTQQQRLAQRKAIDPAVYDLYLRGRHAWNLRTDAGFKAAAAYFEQAIEKEPEFALAYAGLADAHVLGSGSGAPAPESRAKAHSAATRALELDDSLAEAHTSRAALLFFQERNPAAAEREFERALALNRGYPTAHQWYAILLSESGRDAEALKHAQEAVALDPLSGTMYQTLGLVHYYGRRYPEAVTALRRAIDLAPQLPLARAVLAEDALQAGGVRRCAGAADSVPAPQPPDVLVVKGLSYLRQGDQARAAAILKDLESRTPRAGRGAGPVVRVNRRRRPRHHAAAAGCIWRLRSGRGGRSDVRRASHRHAFRVAGPAAAADAPHRRPHPRERCLRRRDLGPARYPSWRAALVSVATTSAWRRVPHAAPRRNSWLRSVKPRSCSARAATAASSKRCAEFERLASLPRAPASARARRIRVGDPARRSARRSSGCRQRRFSPSRDAQAALPTPSAALPLVGVHRRGARRRRRDVGPRSGSAAAAQRASCARVAGRRPSLRARRSTPLAPTDLVAGYL